MSNSTFYFFACQVCKTDETCIRTCAGCKLVSYCSIAHQRRDWKCHKDLCKSIQNISKAWNVTNIFGMEEKTVNEWRHIRSSLIIHVEKCLSRPLRLYEKQMFLFPNVCKVCYSANVNKLYRCQNCNSCQYCCSEHMVQHISKHKEECPVIEKCYILDKMCLTEKIDLNKLLPFYNFPRLNIANFPEDTESYLKAFSNIDSRDSSILLSDPLSGSLTLLYALYTHTKLFSELKSLKIHVIGSGQYELSIIHTVELLFHSFENLKSINVSLIGPEARNDISEVNLCNLCEGNELSIRINPCLYHDLINSEDYEQPHLIIAYNCGFTEFAGTDQDSWAPTIERILHLENIIFVFTSYTSQEAIADFLRVKEIGECNSSEPYIRLQHIENPYKSIRPQRNWEEHEKSIFYINYFLSILETIK